MSRVKGWKLPMVFFAGILVGVLITGVVAAQTGTTVSVYMDEQVRFLFDGQEKELPEDMTVLIHNGRTYTPARFIAEELEAEVGWDEVTRSVLINRPGPEVVEPEEPVEPEVPEEVEEEPMEPEPPEGDFQSLPITKITRELRATLVDVDLNTNETWFFFDIEGRINAPVRVDHRNARLTVDGETYVQKEVTGVQDPVDFLFYENIREGDKISPWIKFGPFDEDTEYMILEVDYFLNVGTRDLITLRYEIEL